MPRMDIKVFAFGKRYFSSWNLDSGSIEHDIKTWLAANPGIRVNEIRHNSYQGIWSPPQLIVSIYFTPAGEP